MSECISAEIWIGGQLKREHVEAFCDAISGQSLQLGFGGEYVAPQTAENLEEAMKELKGAAVLYYCDETADWGKFSHLETWLQEHGVPYTRRTSSSDCYDGELVEFHPGQEPVTLATNANGRPVVSIEPVERAWHLIKEAQQLLDSGKNARPAISQAIDELATSLPAELPPLCPFQIVA
ncbi:MAG TPA: hypothetical protein VHC22_02035 [Pirellulales bacterium]|nr:hypothetical protein [Pirellulales bacterium]